MKHDFEILINSTRKKMGFTWEALSLIVNEKPNNGCNLNKQVKDKSIGTCKFIKLCETLDLDVGETYKLKIK